MSESDAPGMAVSDTRHGMRAPIVSVVIPIFNRQEHLAGVIASLGRQTLANWEAIVVDDGSSINIHAAITPFLSDRRLRYVRLERNCGVSAARNRGVREARGRYVAFLDSDDQWYPDKLAKQVAAMASQRDDAKVFCVTLTAIQMPGGWERIRPSFDPRPGKSFGHYLYVDGGFAQISSLLLARDLAMAHPFREDLRQYEDHLFFIELHACGARYIVIREVLTVWRNDARPDRLSRRDDLGRGNAFVAAASGLLDAQVQCAFRLRALGGVLLRHKPWTALKLVLFGLLQRSLTPRQLAVIVARHMVPAKLWNVMVRPAR